MDKTDEYSRPLDEGKYVDATIVDECEGCAEYDIDLSPSAFSVLAPQSAGRIAVTWNYE